MYVGDRFCGWVFEKGVSVKIIMGLMADGRASFMKMVFIFGSFHPNIIYTVCSRIWNGVWKGRNLNWQIVFPIITNCKLHVDNNDLKCLNPQIIPTRNCLPFHWRGLKNPEIDIFAEKIVNFRVFFWIFMSIEFGTNPFIDGTIWKQFQLETLVAFVLLFKKIPILYEYWIGISLHVHSILSFILLSVIKLSHFATLSLLYSFSLPSIKHMFNLCLIYIHTQYTLLILDAYTP